jgi:hypothetical protein
VTIIAAQPIMVRVVTVVMGALITAIGAIIVALVAALASRAEAKDTRARLLKDLEISSKLSEESGARRVLDRHIAETVRRLVDKEELDTEYRGVIKAVLAASLTSAIALAPNAFQLSQHHNAVNWRDLIADAQPFFYGYAALFLVLSLGRMFIYDRLKSRFEHATRRASLRDMMREKARASTAGRSTNSGEDVAVMAGDDTAEQRA